MTERDFTEADRFRPEIPPGSLVSVTELHLKDSANRDQFLEQVRLIMKQLGETRGMVNKPRIYVDNEDKSKFYTATIWRDLDSMQGFRDSGDHKSAMELAPYLGDTRSANWIDETGRPPSLDEIKQRLDEIEQASLDG